MVSHVVATMERLTITGAPGVVAQVGILTRFRSMSVLVVTLKISSALEGASSTARMKTGNWPVVVTREVSKTDQHLKEIRHTLRSVEQKSHRTWFGRRGNSAGR
jgi:hypothetical protein